MTEVKFYNNSIGVNHSPLPMAKTESFITNILRPQDVNIINRECNNPLHLAVKSGDQNLIKLVQKTGAAINNTGYSLLHTAIECGIEENIRILLEYGARINAKDIFGETPLHLAAHVNYQDKMKMLRIAKLLLEKGSDIKTILNESTDCGDTALHYAIKNNNDELVKLYLQYGANVNAKNRDGKSPLYFAVRFNNIKAATLLIQSGAKVNDKMNRGWTALHEAITQKSENMVKLLLKHGAEVNTNDIFGKTPLHLAACLYYLDEKTMDRIVKLLLDEGADVNEYTNLGETAFHCAVINGNERLVRLFLKYKANVNKKDYDGRSSLHYAVQYSNRSIVKLLLDRGADINERTNDGKMALHVAVEVEDENVTKMLLDYNANVNAVDQTGKTPLSLAFEVAHMRSIYNPWNGFCPIYSESGSDENIFKLLIKHIAKLTDVCKENLKLIQRYEKLETFYTDCQLELEKMKEESICGSISMYKVLSKSMNILVGYLKHEHLSEVFESDLYANVFPIYYQELKDRFYEANSRRLLLEPCSIKIRLIFQPISVPDLITHEILKYLTIEDLVNLKLA